MSFETTSHRLSDVIEIIGGGTPKRKIDEYWNGDIPWLSVVDFNSSARFVNDTVEKITQLGLDKSSTKLLEAGQIIISARGTVGCLAQLAIPMAFNQSCYGLTGKEEFIDNDYLYYLMNLKVEELKQKTHGAVFDTITKETFDHIEVELPSVTVQREMAQILGDLDKKIEINRQTNDTLENIAQAIFKSWFVNFEPTRAKISAIQNGQDPERAAMATISGKTIEELSQLSTEQQQSLKTTTALFPDTLVNSDLGEIPDGWEARPLYETAEYVNGGAFKAIDFCDPKKGLPIIKIAELKQGIYDGTKYTLKDVKQRHFITNDDVLYSWSGSPETSLEVFKWFGGDGWLNQHIFKLNFASDEQKYFTYYLLHHLKPVLIAIAQDKQTTGLGHVTVADMKRLLVPCPCENILRCFKAMIAPMYDQCSIMEKENIFLAEARDTLLPKLLSGEVEVNSEAAA